MPFDIRQLRFAIAAADHSSFHRAAIALDVEQSTLSRSIQKLERVVGVALFRRSRAGVVTTIAGTNFIRDARQIVAKAEHLVSTMRASGQGRAGSLRIGSYMPVSAGNLRGTMFAWSESNPNVEMNGKEASRASLLAGLDAGEIDIAILPGETDHLGMRRAGFWSERIFAALPTSHPLAGLDHVDWIQLRDDTFIMPSKDPGPEMRDMLIARLSVWGIDLNIKMQNLSRETIMSVLGGGSGITVTCEGSAGTQYPDVVLREVHGRHGVSRVGYSGYWKRENENPALRRFLVFVRDRYSLNFDLP